MRPLKERQLPRVPQPQQLRQAQEVLPVDLVPAAVVFQAVGVLDSAGAVASAAPVVKAWESLLAKAKPSPSLEIRS